MFKKAALSSLALLVLFFIPAVLDGREDQPAELNVMVLSGPTGLSLLQMIAEEPELSGVKLNYSVATKPEQLTARLVSGAVDIAALPTNLAAVLYNRGSDPVGGGYHNWRGWLLSEGILLCKAGKVCKAVNSRSPAGNNTGYPPYAIF